MSELKNIVIGALMIAFLPAIILVTGLICLIAIVRSVGQSVRGSNE